MNCTHIQQSLAAYAEGRMPPGLRGDIQAHLHRCPRCRAVLARTDWLSVAVLDTHISGVPPDLHAKVMRAARLGQQPDSSAEQTEWNLWQWWQASAMPLRIAAAITIVVGLSAGLLMGEKMRTSVAASNNRDMAAGADPLDAYAFGFFGEAPEGSLADSYLDLVHAESPEGL